MINLFNRVYLQLDNQVDISSKKNKIFITDRKFNTPYVNEGETRTAFGNIRYYTQLEKAYEECGGRDGFWNLLRAGVRGTVLIVDHITQTRLMCQCWKSIFKDFTEDSAYTLYSIHMNNENLHIYRDKTRGIMAHTVNSTDENAILLTKEDFIKLYRKEEPTDALSNLSPEEISIEHLLASYLLNELEPAAKKVFLKKLDKILRENIASALVAARDDILLESHNFYRLSDEPESEENIVTDPIKFIKEHRDLAWVLDREISDQDMSVFLKKYKLSRMADFFKAYHKLFDVILEESRTIEPILAGNYDAIIQDDICDRQGSFIGTNAFSVKANNLLVSYFYQLYRLKMFDTIKQFTPK